MKTSTMIIVFSSLTSSLPVWSKEKSNRQTEKVNHETVVQKNDSEQPTPARQGGVFTQTNKTVNNTSVTAQEEESFQKLFRAINLNSIDSLTCLTVSDEKGNTHLELSYPSKKLQGNGTFYKIQNPQWKEVFNKGEIFGQTLEERRSKVLDGFDKVADNSRTDKAIVNMRIKYNGRDAGDSSISAIAAFDYERRESPMVSQYYRKDIDRIGSPARVSLKDNDINNICNVLEKWNNQEKTIYNLKFETGRERDIFNNLSFSSVKQDVPSPSKQAQPPAPKKTKK
jgi:hypothetical protein